MEVVCAVSVEHRVHLSIHKQAKGGSRPILGDMLAILATIFFALSNVGEEFCVKKTHRVEVLMMLSLFGTLVTVCEIAIVERNILKSVEWTAEIILAVAGYTIASFLYYTLVPFVLKMSGATLFNLSVLTSDMWAVVFRIFIYHQQVNWLYFVSFGIVVIGLIVYSKHEKDPTLIHDTEDESSTAPFGQYQQLNPRSEES